MALILNIDTALEIAYISLAEDGTVTKFEVNKDQKDHAAWLQPAIKNLLIDTNTKIEHLSAIGVSNGPGSYTGLRVGLSTAKGLCYALNIPLITAGTLEVMALSAKNEATDLICPMIDARRMEVFTAVYDQDLTEVKQPHACIIDEHSYDTLLKGHKILFLGNGNEKFQKICRNPNAVFTKSALNPAAIASLTYRNFIGNNFVEIAYVEPMYIKEFFTIQKFRQANQG